MKTVQKSKKFENVILTVQLQMTPNELLKKKNSGRRPGNLKKLAWFAQEVLRGETYTKYKKKVLKPKVEN